MPRTTSPVERRDGSTFVCAPHREMHSEVVGETATDPDRYTTLEATTDNLLLDADAAGTEIASSNGWRSGAPVPGGKVTVNDLWNIIPANPPVSTVEMTGAEMSASQSN